MLRAVQYKLKVKQKKLSTGSRNGHTVPLLHVPLREGWIISRRYEKAHVLTQTSLWHTWHSAHVVLEHHTVRLLTGLYEYFGLQGYDDVATVNSLPTFRRLVPQGSRRRSGCPSFYTGKEWITKSDVPPFFVSRFLLKNINTKMHWTVILPVFLYACETWSLSWREESRLGVFENRAPRKLLGPTREKVTRSKRKLHDEEIKNLYFPPGGQIKLDGMGGTRDIHGFGGENWRYKTSWKTDGTT